MKKEIEYITVSPQTLEGLVPLLKDIKESEELQKAIASVLHGDSSLLCINTNKNGDEGYKEDNHKIIKNGELTIYVNEHRVTKNDEDVPLTPKEFDILYLLVRNKGDVLSKEQIYQAIWKDNYLLDDGTIMSFIRKLRKKIETNPDNPEYILTIWGIGYKFNDKI